MHWVCVCKLGGSFHLETLLITHVNKYPKWVMRSINGFQLRLLATYLCGMLLQVPWSLGYIPRGWWSLQRPDDEARPNKNGGVIFQQAMFDDTGVFFSYFNSETWFLCGQQHDHISIFMSFRAFFRSQSWGLAQSQQEVMVQSQFCNFLGMIKAYKPCVGIPFISHGPVIPFYPKLNLW